MRTSEAERSQRQRRLQVCEIACAATSLGERVHNIMHLLVLLTKNDMV